MADQPTAPSSASSQYHAALHRIRAEYDEMPGLTLTSAQVARLCGIEGFACVHLLDALVETGYLHKTTGERYVRPAEPRRLRTPAILRRDGWRRGA